MKESDNILHKVNALLGYSETKPLLQQVIEKYEEDGLSENQFCKMLSIPRSSWGDFVKGTSKSNLDIALLIKLAQFLERPEVEVIDLYRMNIQDDERQEFERTKRYSFIINHFDIKNLRKIKFFYGFSSLNFEAIENRIKTYFGFENIYEYKGIEVPPIYSQSKRLASDKMIQFWNTMVRYALQNLDNPNPFNRERFKEVIPLFRNATLDEETGFTKIVRALYACGVTVIVQSYLPNTSIRGATFIVSKEDKPAIVLTNYGKKYATLWQTLAHECYHILIRLEELKRRRYRINSDDQKELFDSEVEEEAAHTFARRLFFDDENMPQLEKYIAFDAIVEQLASAWGVHPSLLYNIYLQQHPDEYAKYSQFLTKSLTTVQQLEIQEPWKAPSIHIPINEMRQKFMPEKVV